VVPDDDADLGFGAGIEYVAGGPYLGFAVAAQAATEQLQGLVGMDLWLVTHVMDPDRHPVGTRPPQSGPLGASGAPVLDDREGRPDGATRVPPAEPGLAMREVVIASAGPWAGRVRPGAWMVWSETLCRRMIEEGGPPLACDIRDVPEYAEMEDRLRRAGLGPVRAYAGMALRRRDGGLFGTVCAFHHARLDPVDPTILPLLSLVTGMLSTILAGETLAAERSADAAAAQALAERDVLTDLRNRRGWNAALDQEQQRAARYGHATSVLVVDMDGLKAINDSGGHAAGDLALQSMASLLGAACRPADVVARTGGDEFCVLAVEAGARAAHALAARIRDRLHPAGLRASVGVATRRRNEQLTETTRRADEAMNKIKTDRRRARAPGTYRPPPQRAR
jgi:diguanylate cyclase (GGDEF)-like protein